MFANQRTALYIVLTSCVLFVKLYTSPVSLSIDQSFIYVLHALHVGPVCLLQTCPFYSFYLFYSLIIIFNLSGAEHSKDAAGEATILNKTTDKLLWEHENVT